MVRALAVGHLCVSAAAIIMVVVMPVAGTRPEAELQGLYALFAVLLLAFGLFTVWLTVFRARRAPPSAGLG